MLVLIEETPGKTGRDHNQSTFQAMKRDLNAIIVLEETKASTGVITQRKIGIESIATATRGRNSIALRTRRRRWKQIKTSRVRSPE